MLFGIACFDIIQIPILIFAVDFSELMLIGNQDIRFPHLERMKERIQAGFPYGQYPLALIHAALPRKDKWFACFTRFINKAWEIYANEIPIAHPFILVIGQVIFPLKRKQAFMNGDIRHNLSLYILWRLLWIESENSGMLNINITCERVADKHEQTDAKPDHGYALHDL